MSLVVMWVNELQLSKMLAGTFLKIPVLEKIKKEFAMFKETIICIVIVIAIIFGNNTTQNYTRESVSELSGRLIQLRESAKKENLKNETIKKEAEDIYQQWVKRHEKLAYFIEHDELEKVETELITIKSDIETETYEELISGIDRSVFILKHIEDKYAFNLENVF